MRTQMVLLLIAIAGPTLCRAVCAYFTTMGMVDHRRLRDPLAPSSSHQKVGGRLSLASVIPSRPHRCVFLAQAHSPAVQCSPRAWVRPPRSGQTVSHSGLAPAEVIC